MTDPFPTLASPTLASPTLDVAPLPFLDAGITLEVSDLGRAIRFYTATLGLRLRLVVGSAWAELEGRGLRIGLIEQAKACARRPAPDTAPVALTLHVESLEQAAEALLARGLTPRRPLPAEAAPPAGRLAFEDPDGNPIWLFELRLV